MFNWLSHLLLMLPLSQAYVQPGEPARLNIPLSFYQQTCVQKPTLYWHDGEQWQQSAHLPNKGGWVNGVARSGWCDLATCSRSPFFSIDLAHYQPAAQAYHYTREAVDGVIMVEIPAYQDEQCTIPRTIRFQLDTRVLPRDKAIPPEKFWKSP